MSSEIITRTCPNCNTDYDVTFNYDAGNSEFKSHPNEVVSESSSKCLCLPSDKNLNIIDKFFESEVYRCLVDGNNERLAEMRDAKQISEMALERRLDLMKHTVSNVNSDFIEVFALKGSSIPKSYFWKIKVENPALAVSDYVQHIWDIQKNNINVENGDAKLITFPSYRRINGVGRRVTAGITVFKYSFFIKKIHENKNYDGFSIESGMGDYLNAEKMEVEQHLYVTCKVERKDRKVPTTYTAWFPENVRYVKGTSQIIDKWKNPSRMLTKIATANAHKLAFPKEVGNINIDYDTMEV